MADWQNDSAPSLLQWRHAHKLNFEGSNLSIDLLIRMVIILEYYFLGQSCKAIKSSYLTMLYTPSPTR
jgi:hypothetical protein